MRWCRLRTFLGFCLLAAVVGGLTVELPHPQGAAAVVKLPRPAAGPAGLPQTITFDQPPDTAVGQPVTLSASTDAKARLVVSFRSDTPAMCTVSGSIVTPNASGFCVITATQGGDGHYAPAPDVARAFRARAGSEHQAITFDQPRDTAVGQPVTLTASSMTATSAPRQTGLTVSFRSDTPDVCTVSGSTVTPTTADVCTITASQGGSDRYAAAQSVRRSFQVHAGTSQQTITFDQPQDTAVGQPVTLSATTDAKDPLVVSFRSDSPAVCTVSGSTVTTVAVGTCTVTAFQGGSDRYAAAQASTSFRVTSTDRIAQQIRFDPVPGATVGVPVVLTASSWTLFDKPISPAGLAVSYSSQTQRVCTVSGATVVPWTAGRCVITASQDGTAEYQPAEPVAQVFLVARASQTISFVPPASATIDQPVTLTATASSWLPVTYASSTPDVCRVSDATVAVTTAGTCTIVASQPGDGQYAPADQVQRSFPVKKIPQTISFTPPASATVGQPVTLTASATSKLTVSFTSDTPGVCTVSGSTVTTIKAGTCAIIASQAGDDRYAAAGSVRQSFPVALIPQAIDFPQPPDAAFGQPVTLTATASSGLPVSYSTSTQGVCTVSGRTVTTRAARACVLTASQAGDARFAPARDVSRTFRVDRATQTITFTPPDGTAIGQPITLSASASSGLTVSYRTDTPAVCTVSGSTVSPATVGTCTITASQPGNDNYAAAPGVSRSFPVHRHGVVSGKTSQAITFGQPPTEPVGQVVPLSASATSGLAVSFRSDTPAVCSVSGATVTTTTAGTCAVTASQAGDDRFAAARDVQRSYAVHPRQGNGQKSSQTIFFGQPPTEPVGQVVPLSASATSGLAVSFRSDTPAVCSVSGATVTTTRAGTCAVTASQAGGGRYLAAPDITESFQVNAGHRSQTISFPQPPEAKVGEAVTLSASATSGLVVAFGSDTPQVCTISGSTLTPTAAGTCTVTASQGGSDQYAAALDVKESFDVASAPSILPGFLTIALAAAVFAAAGVTTLVRRVRRRRSRRLAEHQPSVRAAPVPGPPPLVSVQNNGVAHTVRIESSPGPSTTTIKEARP
jgi:hypothetical protein